MGRDEQREKGESGTETPVPEDGENNKFSENIESFPLLHQKRKIITKRKSPKQKQPATSNQNRKLVVCVELLRSHRRPLSGPGVRSGQVEGRPRKVFSGKGHK